MTSYQDFDFDSLTAEVVTVPTEKIHCDKIAMLAYKLSQKFPDAGEIQNWLRAEAFLRGLVTGFEISN